jgi:hypothetical protein
MRPLFEKDTDVIPHKIRDDENEFTVPYDRKSNMLHDASSEPAPGCGNPPSGDKTSA